MSSSAIVNDGTITNLGSSTKENSNKKADSVDKEQFLNLLVAQMKYQDPLEPMDNTEYVSQLATFSELEQMQNVAKTSEVSRATAMVGSLVTVEATNETTGATTEVTGKVDYVSVSGSNVKVSVNDVLYELSDVKQVFDTDFADARALAEEWASAYGALPGLNSLTAANAGGYADRVKNLYSAYREMSTYQRTFLSEDLQRGIQSYVERMQEYGYNMTGNDNSNASSSNGSTTA